MKSAFSALGVALLLMSSHPGRADEGHQLVRVRCDPGHGTAILDGTVSFNGEKDPDSVGYTMYDLYDLPQYAQHKPARTVCDLGRNRKVLLSAGTNPEHERNNNATVSINTTSDEVGRMFFAEDIASYEIAFLADNFVAITTCNRTSLQSESRSCETKRFRTSFSPTSTNSASFDCAKARTVAEQLICDDARLADQDRAIAFAYRDTLDRATDKTAVARGQSLWRSLRRDACVGAKLSLYPADIEVAKACIRAESRSRLDALKTEISPAR